MIAYIKGKVAHVQLDHVIIEAYGIGYQIHFSRPDKVKLNEEVQMFTYQHIREDENTLYGFLSAAEKDLFIKLISVKGLGPKTAQRIIVDLKDKVLKVEIENQEPGAKSQDGLLIPTEVDSEIKQEAVSALTMLGFAGAASGKVVDKILKATPNASVEQVIREALKML